MTAPGTAVAVAAPGPVVPMTFPQKLAYARELSASDMLPKQFQRKPESVLWAMEYGEALGLRGVVAMSSIHVIQNKPAPSAAMAAGLIRSKGHRLRVYLTPATDAHKWGTAVAELVRADDPEFVFRAEWSVEDAADAQIVKIQAGRIVPNGAMGANWPKYPRQMMKARVIGEVARDGATDVLLGLHYLAEELDGAELDSNGEVVSSGAAPVSASWTPDPDARPVGQHVPDAAPEGNVDGDVVDGDVVPDEEELAGPLTQRTQRSMMALLKKAGLATTSDRDRARRLRVCELLTQRTLTSSTELTERDGLLIEATLREWGAGAKQKVADLLAQDERERAEDAASDSD